MRVSTSVAVASLVAALGLAGSGVAQPGRGPGMMHHMGGYPMMMGPGMMMHNGT